MVRVPSGPQLPLLWMGRNGHKGSPFSVSVPNVRLVKCSLLGVPFGISGPSTSVFYGLFSRTDSGSRVGIDQHGGGGGSTY